MNITQSICYPFKKGNFLRAVLIPSILSLLGSIIWLVPPMVVFSSLLTTIFSMFSTMQSPSEELIISQLESMISSSLPAFWASLGLGVLLSLVFLLPVYGYYWNLIDRLQALGPEAQAPAWKGNLKTYLGEGLQFFMATIVLSVPFIIASIPLGLMVPFVMAAFYLSVKDKTCLSVLRSLMPGFMMTTKRIGPILGAFYLGMILSYIYSFIAGWTIVLAAGGVPIFIHLMCQGYGLQDNEDVKAKHFSEHAIASSEQTLTLPETYQPEVSPDEKSAKYALQDSVMLQSDSDNKQQIYNQFFCHKGDNPWLRHQRTK